MSNFLQTWPTWIDVLFFSAVFVGVITLFGIIVPLFKPRIKRNSAIYLYGFATGFFLVLALFGLLRDSITSLATLKPWVSVVVVSGGALFGMLLGLFSRFVVVRSNKEIHVDHASHAHADLLHNYIDADNPRNKWTAIYMLLGHRVVAGLTLGLIIFQIQNNESNFALRIGLVIGFIIHLIPELLIIYYRQIEIGVKRWKAVLFAIIVKVIMVPLIFIGAYLGQGFESQPVILPLLLAIFAGTMAFTSLFELIPEFLHTTHTSNKHWYRVALVLIAGFVLAIIILSYGTI